jgi:hypothetical protein
MKKLQILGTGCPKCSDLANKTEQAAKELGIDYELIKVSDINDIMSISGKVPGVVEIMELIS